MKAEIMAAGMLFAFAISVFLVFVPVQAQPSIADATFCSAGQTRTCQTVGICKGQVKVCENGKWSEICTGGVRPASLEICDNGLDDNCDGGVDECVSLTGSIGYFLIGGGVALLIFALILSKVMK
jgi:hypothetical protein